MSSETSTSPGEPLPAASRKECRTSLIRQKPGARARRRPAVQAQDASEEAADDPDSVRARLERIETLLKAANEKNITDASTASHVIEDNCNFDPGSNDNENCGPDVTTTWKFDAVRPTLYHGPGPTGTPLPPLYDLMPIIHQYFNTFNQVSPLFDRKTFTRMVIEWYNQKATRSRVAWAAILAVCALGLRAPTPGTTLFEESSTKKNWENYCVRNAQTVVPELLTREEDLLGVQTLLALGILYHQGCDQRGAGAFVGMALRLAHRMRLHSKLSAEFFSAEEILQRSNAFWIAYTLDKDISMRTSTPSGQLDQDIDVPLPPMNPQGPDEDDNGLIWTRDRTTSFNHFRMRLDLAHIQGKLYDLIYSNRSLKINAVERQTRVETVQKMLINWMARIPTAFRVEHVSATVGEIEIVHMVTLYHSYLVTITFLHGIYSQQSEWVKRVGTLARYALQDYTTSVSGHATECLAKFSDPPTEKYWYHCVEFSRSALKLFQEAIQSEWLVWQCTCAHFSGLIILLSNSLMNPTHEFASLDNEISAVALQLLDSIVTETDRGVVFLSLQKIVNDLSRTSKAAVAATRIQQENCDSDDVFGQSLEGDWFPGQTDLSMFGDGDEAELTGTFDLNAAIDPFLQHGRIEAGDGVTYENML